MPCAYPIPIDNWKQKTSNKKKTYVASFDKNYNHNSWKWPFQLQLFFYYWQVENKYVIEKWWPCVNTTTIVTFHHFNWKWHPQIQLKVIFNYNLPLDEFHPLTNHENHQTIKTCITFFKNNNIQLMRIDLSITHVELIIEEKIMATV